jgi:vacuolar-type H+-ATPase subunit E/Vma4
MSETNPNETRNPNDNISDQLNELGKNLREALRSAWEREERRKLQKDIEEGLANLGESLSQAAKDFSNSPAGQSLKEDVQDIRERWQSGEMGSKVQSEIVEALRKVNHELQKTVKENPPPPSDKPGG